MCLLTCYASIANSMWQRHYVLKFCFRLLFVHPLTPVLCDTVLSGEISMKLIIIIIFVYYSCSQTATTASIENQQAVTQDSTDTIECKAGIQRNITQGLVRVQ